nr:glycosyl hydrolase [Chryseolinea sp.]
QQWKDWAHGKNAIVRNQAHGAPSNILDLYATVDIPEIEGVEPLRIKMASSAGNVTGKKLVSSESATWLNEHFESNLADIKIALDRFMVNGVNHIFYHGTSYSPPNEPWPGWLFYAAVHLNPRNSLWKDFDALNLYTTRCQSFLQNSTPDNDVLLYYPIYDRFSTPGKEMIEHFDGIGKQFDSTAFKHAAELMLEKDYAFDYISDNQIGNIVWENDQLKTEGNSEYKTLLIPKCNYIPLKTFQKIISLAEQGATIIALEGLPGSISGYGNLEKNKNTFTGILNKLGDVFQSVQGMKEIKVGKGVLLIGDNAEALLEKASVRKENLTDKGIQFIRKKRNDQTFYFLINSKDDSFEGWLPLEEKTTSYVMYDPMDGKFGVAKMKNGSGGTEVYVQLEPHQSIILETNADGADEPSFSYYENSGIEISLTEKWNVNFTDGGPVLPVTLSIDSLTSWTAFGNSSCSNFSGTATYSISFPKPLVEAQYFQLDLGKVKESAEVVLNGKLLGTLIGSTYKINFASDLLKENNLLEIKVSNLMANRIADLDQGQIFWRKFYNVNFPARKVENRTNGLFDASHWQPKESGLLGPVFLKALKPKSDF